jgi:hypothetical protein
VTIFIQKGDVPMSRRQAIKRGLRYFEAEKQQHVREQGLVESDPEYIAWAAYWIEDNKVNAANNLFNYQLAGLRKAVARLARFRLADGRPEITAEVETGELDPETFEPITEVVVTQRAVEPLPATVTVPTYDPETFEPTGEAEVPNPLIVTDDTERAAAQAVVDATPAEVLAFDATEHEVAA